MKILLRPNFDKPGSLDCTRRVLAQLHALGMTPLMDARPAAAVKPEEYCVTGDFHELLKDCDLVLTIGGDGTILHAVQATLHSGKPLLGINTGRIGFLTQLESDELHHLALVKEEKYTLFHRMMLDVFLELEGRRECYTALNDVVISRGDSERLVEIEIACGDQPVTRHRADGVILATPTGSTAYSLSAGGSIADPSLDLIVMTAICPHSHFNHSLILSPQREYTVRELPGNNTKGLQVIVDGMRVGRMMPGSAVTVRQSQGRAPFIDLGLRDFYQCVDQKLALGGRIP